MKNILRPPYFFISMLIILLIACDQPDTVEVGKQTWMKENLNITHFRNGDPIPVCKDFSEWLRLSEAGLPACAAYDFDRRNRKKYGLLYNWYAVSDPRGLAPEGFRIPTEKDFALLLEYCGGKPYRSGRALRSLLPGGRSGFDALYGGWAGMIPDPEAGTDFFMDRGINAAYWSSGESGVETAWNMDLGRTVRNDTESAYLDGSSPKHLLFSVRCIQNTPVSGSEND